MGASGADSSRYSGIAPGVWALHGDAVSLSSSDIDMVAREARELGRCSRILLHKGTEDPLQEMVIAHPRGMLFMPHRSNQAIRSYHLLRGRMTMVLFDDDGTVDRHIQMKIEDAGGPFAFRFSGRCYHTVIVQSEVAVFMETAPGPFSGTEYPTWSPPYESEAAEAYRRSLLSLAGM